jgi:Fur family ferric uptake transcriptional regulator
MYAPKRERRANQGAAVTIDEPSPSLFAPSLPAALGILRARGLRISAARRLILDALYRADRPVGADELAGRISADLASVYRNLGLLEDVGLVRHVRLGRGPGLYSLASAARYEFVSCERCGVFEAIDPARLEDVRALIARELGYRANFSQFPIVGVCAGCEAPAPGDQNAADVSA